MAEAQQKQQAIFNEQGIQKRQKLMLNKWLFRLSMLKMLPMGFISGMHITKMNDELCEVKVKYKYLNKNPFNTTYWAVLGMAAELTGGALLVNYARNVKPSVATFVVSCNSRFVNRALGVTTFVCNDAKVIKENVALAASTGEGHTFETSTIGYDKDGKVVAEFDFVWSVKGRKR